MNNPSKITAEDQRKFFKEYYLSKGRTEKIMISVIIIILSALAIYNKKTSAGVDTLIPLLIISFVVFAISFTVPYTMAIMRLELQGDAFPFEGYTIDLSHAGIIVTGGGEPVLYNFSNVKKTYVTQNYAGIWFYRKLPKLPSKILLVHKRDIDPDSDVMRLFYNRPNSTAPPAPNQGKVSVPYAWAILGIIPFVGGVNGIIMIVNGIFRFKNTLYVILGAFGVLFTLAVLLMFYFMKPDMSSKVFNNSFSEASRKEMNDLVKSIEFYKLQHSQYPDSLQQLSDEDQTIDIHDPIYTFKKGKEGMKFNYKRIGNKYTLYSSGIDMIAHTADDIYPDVLITDTSKLGFIKADTINIRGKRILKTE